MREEMDGPTGVFCGMTGPPGPPGPPVNGVQMSDQIKTSKSIWRN